MTLHSLFSSLFGMDPSGQGYSFQFLVGLTVMALLIVFMWAVRWSRPSRKAMQPSPALLSKTKNNINSHYHLGFLLGAMFLVVLLAIFPFIHVLGIDRPFIDSWMRLKSLLLLLIGGGFLILALMYVLKKGDFKWNRPF